MATKPGEALELEMEPASPEEEEPVSDFDVAADAFAKELGVPATPTFKRAAKELVMACMNTDYEAEEEPAAEEDGLALIFGSGKPKR